MADYDRLDTDLTIESEERNGVLILHIAGHLNEMGTEVLGLKLDELFEKGKFALILDLGEVGFISSVGLGQIMRAYRTINQEGGRLRLVDLQPLVVDVFEVTKLDKLLEIYSTVAQALSSQ